MDENEIRLISAREASKKEKEDYWFLKGDSHFLGVYFEKMES